MKIPFNLLVLGCVFAVSASALAGGWSVSGRILDEAGTPIGSASIHAAGATHSVDESGAFRIDVEA